MIRSDPVDIFLDLLAERDREAAGARGGCGGAALAISPLIAIAPADRLRDGIGRALRHGDVDHIVELYLGLATMLAHAGDSWAALDEITEGIDIVTSGRGAEGEEGPFELWRLLLLAGQLHSRSGSAGAARVAAAHAHRHASRVGSMRGARNAEWLLRHLRL